MNINNEIINLLLQIISFKRRFTLKPYNPHINIKDTEI